MNDKIYDVIIIGEGPAGLTAAIYTARAGVNTLVIANGNKGSLSKAHMIDNYPGFPDGIAGSDLNDLMKKQAIRFKANIITGTLLDMDITKDIKVVKTDIGNYKCKYLIIAAGTGGSSSKVTGEEHFTGSGVSYCATCDGAFTKGLNVSLFGQGEEVCQEALFLTDHTPNIKIFVPDEVLKCTPDIMNALTSKGVQIIYNAVLKEILGTEYVEKVKADIKGTLTEYPCDFAFLYLGTKNNTELYGAYFKLDKNGNIITDQDMMTDIQGVYAIGDIRSKAVRQVTTAVNDGTIAALAIMKERLRNTDK